MKLIDILVQELPKRGGWPEGVNSIEQDDNGAIFEMDSNYVSDFQFELTNDWLNAIVTREQYEAACNAWNSEGLPPVGVECETRFKHDTPPKWYTFKALFVSTHNVVALVGDDELTYHIDELSRDNVDFRPIRPEADRKRDKAIDAIRSIIREGYVGRDDTFRADKIYDAVKSGEIVI